MINQDPNNSRSMRGQQLQLWLFVGILLFATLAVPAIAWVTREAVARHATADTSVRPAPTTATSGAAPMISTVDGGSGNCSNTLGIGADAVIANLCSERMEHQ